MLQVLKVITCYITHHVPHGTKILTPPDRYGLACSSSILLDMLCVLCAILHAVTIQHSCVTDTDSMSLTKLQHNKYASYSDWHISAHANRHHRASGGQFVTRGWRLSGQFVTPGDMAVQCIIDFSLFHLGG